MRTQIALALFAGLLLGHAHAAPAEPAPKAQKDVEKGTVVIPENATITIAPGTKIHVSPVKTEQGKRIRLELPGVVIEAVRLRVKSKGVITKMKIGAGDTFDVRTIQEGD